MLACTAHVKEEVNDSPTLRGDHRLDDLVARVGGDAIEGCGGGGVLLRPAALAASQARGGGGLVRGRLLHGRCLQGNGGGDHSLHHRHSFHRRGGARRGLLLLAWHDRRVRPAIRDDNSRVSKHGLTTLQLPRK